MINTSSINGAYFTRAIAISLIVANHSTWLALGGGMNFLMLLAGFNLACFSFSKSNKSIANDMINMLIKIIIPTLVIIIFYCFLYREFQWQEVLMVSFLFPSGQIQISEIPIWYSQVLMQMCILLLPFMFIFNFANKVKIAPITTTLVILFVSVFINWLSFSDYPWARLPHLFLWNFTLGWALWALLRNPTSASKMQCTFLVISISGVMFLRNIEEFPFLIYRFSIFTLLTIAFIWLKNITLPSPLVRVLTIIAQSIFFIFLFHRSFITLYDFLWAAENNNMLTQIFRYIFAMSSSILVWALYVSTTNTLKRYKKEVGYS